MVRARLSWARVAFLSVLLACGIAVLLGTPGAFALDQDEIVEEVLVDAGTNVSSSATGALESSEAVETPNAASDGTAASQDTLDVSQVPDDASIVSETVDASKTTGDGSAAASEAPAADAKTNQAPAAAPAEKPAEGAPAEAALAAADDAASYEDTHVNMYRLYNPNSGEHFYTASLFEAQSVATAGWRWEGVGWVAPTVNDRPVFRLYNPNAGDHHYTLSSYERDHLVSVGWSYEGVGWYSDAEDQIAVFREYNPNAVAGAHNFTTSPAEDEFLGGVGWSREGVAWHATDGERIPIDGFWLVTSAWGSLNRYWIGSDANVAKGRLIDPSEGSGWWAFATWDGPVARGKINRGDGYTYIADDKGELASTEDGADGWLVTADYDGGLQRYYYVASEHAMRPGLFEVNGVLYYGLPGDGFVARNQYLYGDGQWYYANNDGVLSPIDGGEVRNALISVIDHASGAGYLTLMGGANYNLGSAAGARLASAVQQIWAAGSGVGFVMMDLTTGHGVACSPHDVRYSASTIKGPYVAAINHFAPGAVDDYVAWLMNDTIRYSSNEDYAELREIFGGDIMQWQMDYSGVGTFSPHSWYVDYSAADLAKLWVGNYWYFYKDTNERSGWCRDLYTQGEVGADALIFNALAGSYTVHAKPGWFPGSGYDVQNDAGIVMAGERPYVLSILSSACMNYGALTELIWALDAVHSDMA